MAIFLASHPLFSHHLHPLLISFPFKSFVYILKLIVFLMAPNPCFNHFLDFVLLLQLIQKNSNFLFDFRIGFFSFDACVWLKTPIKGGKSYYLLPSNISHFSSPSPFRSTTYTTIKRTIKVCTIPIHLSNFEILIQSKTKKTRKTKP